MVVNIVGECDNRPVLYTIMKILQSFGDVLLITNSSRLTRLSDTGESYGHFQNTMVAVNLEGIDDFFENFVYDFTDFEHTIVHGQVAAEANLTIYVKGLVESDAEKDMLEYLDKYETIDLYMGKGVADKTMFNCERFEAYKSMVPINSIIAKQVATCLAPHLNTTPENLLKVASEVPVGAKMPKKQSNFSIPKIGGKR